MKRVEAEIVELVTFAVRADRIAKTGLYIATALMPVLAVLIVTFLLLTERR